MATNLSHNLTRLRLISTTKIDDDDTPQETAPKPTFSSPRKNDHHVTKIAAEINDQGEELECHTPTSDENKIPSVLICPPAPRKPTRKSSVSCKRKLFDDEFGQFFEILNREEVDEFFRSSFELVERSRMIAKKKRCKCT